MKVGVSFYQIQIQLTGVSAQEYVSALGSQTSSFLWQEYQDVLQSVPGTALLITLARRWARKFNTVALKNGDEWWVRHDRLSIFYSYIKAYTEQIQAIKQSCWNRELYIRVRDYLTHQVQLKSENTKLLQRKAMALTRMISYGVSLQVKVKPLDIKKVVSVERILRDNFYQAVPWHSIKRLYADSMVPVYCLERFSQIIPQFELYIGLNPVFDRIFRAYCQMCRPILTTQEALLGAKAKEFYRRLSELKRVLQGEGSD